MPFSARTVLVALLVVAPLTSRDARAQSPNISAVVTIDPAIHTEPLDGRMILLFSRNGDSEPRFPDCRGHQCHSDFRTGC